MLRALVLGQEELEIEQLQVQYTRNKPQPGYSTDLS